eukprot:3378051-Pyramimonas_sp.AAC.1
MTTPAAAPPPRHSTMDEDGSDLFDFVGDDLHEFAPHHDAQLLRRHFDDARDAGHFHVATEAQRAEVSSMENMTAAPNSELNDDVDCAGAPRAPQQMPLLDRLRARARDGQR